MVPTSLIACAAVAGESTLFDKKSNGADLASSPPVQKNTSNLPFAALVVS